jgi:RimJ/RimL family protein N-acetyltransferase
MRHDLSSSRYGVRLRPIDLEDAAFVVALRTNVARARFLHPIPPDIAAQERWLTTYFDRRGDYYFVAERESDHRREGLISVYDLDEKTHAAEWGRWIFRPDSSASIAAAVQLFDLAFHVIGLDRLLARTVAEHEALIRFHDSTGATRTAVFPEYIVLGGVAHDALEHTLTREAWTSARDRLGTMAAIMAAA